MSDARNVILDVEEIRDCYESNRVKMTANQLKLAEMLEYFNIEGDLSDDNEVLNVTVVMDGRIIVDFDTVVLITHTLNIGNNTIKTSMSTYNNNSYIEFILNCAEDITFTNYIGEKNINETIIGFEEENCKFKISVLYKTN